ncbi:MAG: hypothetical protein SH850_04405 [Planctomycetaceae bacterium]|nr:hypothetical protein [Planctomycetaceae bacterium]
MLESNAIKTRQPGHVLFWLTLVTGMPLWLATGSYFAFWLTEPPSFPGDPDIGMGLVYFVALFNLPVLVLAWIGWGIWAFLRKPGDHPTA